MKNLSIVFQGAASNHSGQLSDEVMKNLTRTRLAFPRAEIILSSWNSYPDQANAWQQRLQPLGVRLVLSEDPGALIGTIKDNRYVTNLNRLRVSASAGLAVASRTLAVKLRTDSFIYNRKLILLLAQHVMRDTTEVPRDTAFRVFRARVINASWFARDARGSLPYLYHPGDIFLAGHTEDLRLFFNAPAAGPTIFSPVSMPGLGCPWRFVPEQWFWVHAIYQATGKWVYQGNFDHSAHNIAASEQWYMANFVPFSARMLGFSWPKYWRCYPLRGLFSTYTHSRWQRLAARYQEKQRFSLPDVIYAFFIHAWRCGYRFRRLLLRCNALHRLALRFFVHRSE
ncbi:WavE lipopolysaccharide synthesis family protein [Pantoea sp. Lu_F5_004]|uniref:WavE lipopolysaccharide synthesis family protein n=1 Tax=Pantoea sp. Lu_F5_004 TaxID=3443507 RepID=UPI003EBDD9F9